MSGAADLDIDPAVPGFFLRPDYYDVLARLRAESPVHQIAPGTKLVSRYHDIREISRDPQRFCSGRGVLVNDPLRAGGTIEGSILHMDPPQHNQWRRILNREFAGRALSPMETTIRRLAVQSDRSDPVRRGGRHRRSPRRAAPRVRDRGAPRCSRRPARPSSVGGRMRPSPRPTARRRCHPTTSGASANWWHSSTSTRGRWPSTPAPTSCRSSCSPRSTGASSRRASSWCSTCRCSWPATRRPVT